MRYTVDYYRRVRRAQVAHTLRLAFAWTLLVSGAAGFVVLLGWAAWRFLLLVTA